MSTFVTMNRINCISLLFVLTLLPLVEGGEHRYIYSRPIAEVLGSTHVSGRYYFGEKDFLNEGADRLLELGMGGFKGWFTPGVARAYPYNSDWPEDINSLVDLARTPYFRELFEKPFNVYSFVVGEFNRVNWKQGVSDAQRASIEEEFYQLSRYLLTQYQNSGKTFILQNWEGDNALRAWVIDDPDEYETARKGMVEWLNARQDGIARARREVGMEGVRVVGAIEMTRTPVGRRPFDHPLVVDDVVPYTYSDLYAFSTWGTRLPGDEALLFDQLKYIAAKAPPSELYGQNNLMMGEFGAYELTYTNPEHNYPELKGKVTPGQFDDYSALGQLTANRKQFEYAMQAGVRYAFYWELYCNGLRDGLSLSDMKPDANGFPVATPDQLKGVWLIRPDGSIVPTYHYFRNLIEGNYIADMLKDWSRVRARSENLQRKPQVPFVGNQASVPGSLLYYVPGIKFASVRILESNGNDDHGIKVFLEDGNGNSLEREITYEVGPFLDESGWRYAQLIVDVGQSGAWNYLRIETPPKSADRVRINKVVVEGSAVNSDENRQFYRFAELDGLLIDGNTIENFDPAITEWRWETSTEQVPEIEILVADPRLEVKWEMAESIPGETHIHLNFPGEPVRTYTVEWIKSSH